MPNKHLVKFDDDGEICKKNINYLRRNPECGFIFYEDKPFTPINPPPRPPEYYKQYKRDFDIDRYRDIPPQPEYPSGQIPHSVIDPRFRKLKTFDAPQLPQDETNEVIQGKRNVTEIIDNIRQGSKYQSVPINHEFSQDIIEFPSYENQTIDRVVQDLDGLIQQRLPAPSDIELQEMPQQMTEEELIDLQIKQTKGKTPKIRDPLKKVEIEPLVVLDSAREKELVLQMARKFTSENKPKITFNDVKKILNKLVPKLIRPETIYDILNENNLYDAYYEDEFRKIQPEDREFLRLFQKQNVKMQREMELQELPDTNLIPEKLAAPFEPLEIEEFTGLTDRPGIGFESQAKSQIKKQIANRAKKLAPELIPEIRREPVVETPEFEEEFIGELQEVQLSEAQRPKLSLKEQVKGFVVGRAAAGFGAGLGAGYGTAELMQHLNIHNPAAIGADSGAVGGAVTNVSAYALERGAGRTLAAGARSAITGAIEGAALGVVSVPLDMYLNQKFRQAGMSATGSNLLSTGIVGAGTTAVIGGVSLAAAPETLGASLVVGAVAIGISEAIAFFSGWSEDKKEQERKDKINNINTKNQARTELLQSLPKYNYNFTKALANFKNKNKLGMNEADWTVFSKHADSMFNPKPRPIPPDPSKKPTGDDKRVSDIMNRYIKYQVIKEACKTNCTEELERQLPRELSKDEIDYLDDKTAGTWKNLANITVQQTFMEYQYTNKRVTTAREKIISGWETNKLLPKNFSEYDQQTANMDGKWLDSYKKYLNKQALDIAVDEYYNNNKKYNELDQNIINALNYDKTTISGLNNFYNEMQATAERLKITTEQLVELQQLPFEDQKRKYNQYQFERQQRTPEDVAEAQKLASIQDKVKAGGYYDLDEAILKTDPTSITSWRPSDSQILQAHQAGLTLQQYVDYTHELAKGEQGDFSNLPELTNEQISVLNFRDWDQFENELVLAGLNPNSYRFNYQSGQIIPVNDPEPITEQPRELQEEVTQEAEDPSLPPSFLPYLYESIDRVAQTQKNIETNRQEAINNQIAINEVDTNLNNTLSQGVQINPDVVVASA